MTFQRGFSGVRRGRSGLLFVWSSTEQSLGAEAFEGADDFSFLLFFTQEVRGARGAARAAPFNCKQQWK